MSDFKTSPSIRGFSIMEMLITAAIIGIITALVTFKYGSFNNLILLKNQAYQIALELREMQSRSISAVGNNEDFRRPYGLYFSTANRTQYIVFIDMNDPGEAGHGYYNPGEQLEVRKLDSRFSINRLCSATNCALSALSVTFVRPNFDAVMNGGTVVDGRIEVVSLSNTTNVRVVSVNGAGQITVE